MKRFNNVFNGLLKLPKMRILSMFTVLIVVSALVVLGYTYGDWGEYSTGPQYDGYHHYAQGYDYGLPYYNDAPTYIGISVVSLGDRYVYLGDFDVFDYESNLMSYDGYVYYICFETMGGYLIMPLMGLHVIFNPNTNASTHPGNHMRPTTTGTSAGGTIGGPAQMPLPPYNQGDRTFMGWNTQADGRGAMFTYNSWVCANDGVDGNGSFTVFAMWGINVNFEGNGIVLAPGTDPNNPNHFLTRLIPQGWSVEEAGFSWVRDLNATDRPGHTFVGWYSVSAPTGGEELFGNTEFNNYATVTVFARWMPDAAPIVTFALGGGSLGAGHQATRQARMGWSINDSSFPTGFGQPPELNQGVQWPRSAPLVTHPVYTVEGWWLQANGWNTGGNTRWGSPGSAHSPGQTAPLPLPNSYLYEPVTGNITVHPHWVLRVNFELLGGHLLPQPAGFYDGPLFRDVPLANSGMPLSTHGFQRNYLTDQPEMRGMPPQPMTLPPAPTNAYGVYRPGFTFNGWWTQHFNTNQRPDLTNPELRFTGTTPITTSTTVFAHWVPNDTVTVTFWLNDGGTNTAHWYRGRPEFGPGPGSVVRPADPFAPWVTEAVYGSSINASSIAIGARATFPLFPRRPGYMFMGWYPQDPVTGERICARCSAPNPFSIPAGNCNQFHHNILITNATTPLNAEGGVDIVARWEPYINVIFDSNGGDQVPLHRPMVLGYAFSGISYGVGTLWGTGWMGAPSWNPWVDPPVFQEGHPLPDPGPGGWSVGVLALATIQNRTTRTTNTWDNVADTVGSFARIYHTWSQPTTWNELPTAVGHPPSGVAYSYRLRGALTRPGVTFGAGTDEITFYMQWGVNITFDANMQTLGGGFTPGVTRSFTIADGFTFANNHLHGHMDSNNQLQFPYLNTAAQRALWPEVALEVPSEVSFIEWNTCPNGTGYSFGGSNTQVPIHNSDFEFITPMTLYAIWGNRIYFHHGHGPAGSIALADQARNFSPGQPFSDFPQVPVDLSGNLTFFGWNRAIDGSGASLPLSPPYAVFQLADAGSRFYAVWSVNVTFDPNGGVLTALDLSNNPVPGTIPTLVNVPLQSGLPHILSPPARGAPSQYWQFGRWRATPGGTGTIYTTSAPNITSTRTIYAQWDGMLNFNPSGGTLPGQPVNTAVVEWLPEGFSVANNTTQTMPVSAGPPPVYRLPAVPENPTHADPSMVFVGWRITSVPAYEGSVLTRTQVQGIVMNGHVDGDISEPRNAPNGRIDFEAVWHQRLVFTKTGELLYLVYPSTNDAEREIQPRSGAEFRLYRNTSTTPGTPTWTPVVNSVTSGAPALVNAVNTATGNLPFAGAISSTAIPGLVVFNLPTTVALTPGGQYRLYEVQPPLGYMREGGYWIIDMHPASTHPDARINTITAVAPNILPFIDWNTITDTPRAYLLQDFHVGNRRPRLMFTKLNREGEPLNGVRFVLERYNTVTNTWEAMPDEYQPELSGLNGQPIPLFPGQAPHPLPPPSPDGIVLFPRPFPYNSAGQFRLRETAVPDSSGYLIPMFGRWNITTNRYSGVTAINLCTVHNVAPAFVFDPPSPIIVSPNAGHPRPWDGYWSIRNTPTRHWPILKTDGQITTSSIQHSYLGGAVFKLFVWEGEEIPGANVLLSPNDIMGGPGSLWTLVAEEYSTGGLNPVPMWFPMMPGRTYQLVEVLAPVGYQLPWGQWRFTVYGAECTNTVAGTRLTPQTIGWGTPNVVPQASNIQCQHIHVTSGYSCACVGDCTAGCVNDCTVTVTRAYHIPNLPDFSLPLTGGTGVSLVATVAGTLMAVVGSVVLLYKVKKKRRSRF